MVSYILRVVNDVSTDIKDTSASSDITCIVLVVLLVFSLKTLRTSSKSHVPIPFSPPLINNL